MPDGPGGFAQDSTCPALLRVPLRFAGLRVRGCRPLWRRFPAPSPRLVSCDLAALQPRGRLDAPGLGSSPSARRYSGNHSLFSLPAGTKMFQFPAFASGLGRMAPTRVPGCPIRTSADQRSLAPPRGFSQLATSFVACESLGIHRAPLHVSSPSCGHPLTGSRAPDSLLALVLDCVLYVLFLLSPCCSQYVNDLSPGPFRDACGE